MRSSCEPPAVEDADEHVGHQDREHQHPEPYGRRVAEIEEPECRFVEPYGDDLGCVAWSAVGGNRDDVEVTYGVHGTDEERDDDDAHYRGRDDVPEPFEVVGPGAFGGFDDGLVHRIESCE